MDKETSKGIFCSLVGSQIHYTRFTIVEKSISPRSVDNLKYHRDKEHNAFP